LNDARNAAKRANDLGERLARPIDQIDAFLDLAVAVLNERLDIGRGLR
jgi:hypothetical protein